MNLIKIHSVREMNTAVLWGREITCLPLSQYNILNKRMIKCEV